MEEAATMRLIGETAVQMLVSMVIETFVLGMLYLQMRQSQYYYSVLIAIYTVLVFHASRLMWYVIILLWVMCMSLILWRKRNRTMISRCIPVIVAVMFLLAVASWSIDIHNAITEVRIPLLSYPADAWVDRYSAARNDILRWVSIEDVLYSYMVSWAPAEWSCVWCSTYPQTILGDSIIIWRVYVFWSDGNQRLVVLIPCSFLVGSVCEPSLCMHVFLYIDIRL